MRIETPNRSSTINRSRADHHSLGQSRSGHPVLNPDPLLENPREVPCFLDAKYLPGFGHSKRQLTLSWSSSSVGPANSCQLGGEIKIFKSIAYEGFVRGVTRHWPYPINFEEKGVGNPGTYFDRFYPTEIHSRVHKTTQEVTRCVKNGFPSKYSHLFCRNRLSL